MKERMAGLFLSALTGLIMIIFMLASVTDRELFRFQVNLFGFSIGVGINVMELLIPLAAVIVSLGTYYALSTYLPVEKDQIALHLFLPFAVTLTIGFTLRNMRGGLTGWVLLFITGILLYLVLRFEFIACDPDSSGRPVSVAVLESLCYAVFLLFTVSLRANVSRLTITLPAIFTVAFALCLKIYSFHIIEWSIPWLSAVTAVVMCFADAGLHYWPVNIISYGAVIFIWYYAFTNFVLGADRSEQYRVVLRRILPVGTAAVGVFIYGMIQM